MYPELWTIPIINYTIKSYGLMLMIGFLSAVYIAARRAEKVRVNPDAVINLGFFALIGGVTGARIFYVIHYWDRYFAGTSSPILAILDVTRGGMEFLGGVIGAFVLIIPYLLIKRESIRLYLDILTPGVMWGLAFGRIGCLLNGCCWGGICEGTVAERWGVTFPFGSPAYIRQYERRHVKVPGPLLAEYDDGQAAPLDRRLMKLHSRDLTRAARALADAQEELAYLQRLDPDSKDAQRAKRKIEHLQQAALREQQRGIIQLGRCDYANIAPLRSNLSSYPSQDFTGQTMTLTELQELARSNRSRIVHPTQLYASINAFLASFFLAWVFRVRRRHGLVFAVMLMTYPISRFILELIRVDNPADSFGLTISQFVGLSMLVAGVLMYMILCRLPLHSPHAKPWDPPPAES